MQCPQLTCTAAQRTSSAELQEQLLQAHQDNWEAVGGFLTISVGMAAFDDLIHDCIAMQGGEHARALPSPFGMSEMQVPFVPTATHLLGSQGPVNI